MSNLRQIHEARHSKNQTWPLTLQRLGLVELHSTQLSSAACVKSMLGPYCLSMENADKFLDIGSFELGLDLFKGRIIRGRVVL